MQMSTFPAPIRSNSKTTLGPGSEPMIACLETVFE